MLISMEKYLLQFDEWHFEQGKGVFVHASNMPAMLWHVKRSAKYFRYYPSIKIAGFGPFPFSFMLVYLALCLTPLILNGREDVKWKRLRSGS